MSQITADAQMLQKLRQITIDTEIVDEQGNSVGVFRPHSPELDALYQQARTRHTDEELERLRSRGGKEFTPAELRSRLEKLP